MGHRVANFTLSDAVGGSHLGLYGGTITGTSGFDTLSPENNFIDTLGYDISGTSQGLFHLNYRYTFTVSSPNVIISYYIIDEIEKIGGMSLHQGTVADDTFQGGTSYRATYSGGDGIDLVSYQNSTDPSDYIFSRAANGSIAVAPTTRSFIDYMYSVEQLEIGGVTYSLTASSGADLLIGSPVIGVHTIDGGDGDDYIVGLDTPSSPDIVYGGRGNDTLFGTQVYGGDGDDVITVTQENSTVQRIAVGGAGNDTISSTRDVGYAGNLADFTLRGNTDGTFTVTDNVGNEGTDTLLDFDTVIFADQSVSRDDLRWFVSEGDDVISGFSNVDALGGDDIITGTAGDDVLIGGPGSDTISGGEGSDSIYADSEDVFTNLNGGTGGGNGVSEPIDTLYLTTETYANGDLDFLGQEFERAIITNAAGDELGSYRLSDYSQSFVENDVDDTQDWYRKIQYYERPGEDRYSWFSRETIIMDDASDRLITTYFDDGSMNEWQNFSIGPYSYRSKTFDTADAMPWSTVATYYSYTHYINDYELASIRQRFVVEYDDSYTSDEVFVIHGPDKGASTRTLTDTASIESWESWTFEYNSDRQAVSSARLNDSGILNTITYDRAGEFDWATRAVNTDVSANVNYTSTTREMNAAGETVLFSIDYDTGFTVTWEYDVANTDPWSKIITFTDADDTESWAQKAQYFDETNAIYQTFWYAEPGETETTFNGTTDNDRLISTLENFVYLDYAGSGFETGRVYNAQGEQLGLYYVSSQGYGVYQNYDTEVGVSRISRHVDLASDQTWSSRDFTFSPSNELKSLVTKYDDGLEVTIDYDLAGVHPYTRVVSTVDTGDILPWDRKEAYIGDDGTAYKTFYHVNAADAPTVTGASDNDRLIIESETFVAVDHAAQGFEEGRVVNAAGDVLGQYYVGGTGYGTLIEYDLANTESWVRKVTLIDIAEQANWTERDYFYNAANQVQQSVTRYDDGTQYTVTFDRDFTEDWVTETYNEDLADNFDWTTIFQRTDDSGVLSRRLVDNDVGFTEITDWDVEGIQAWARLYTLVDVDNTESWGTAKYYYNDAGDLYDTVFS